MSEPITFELTPRGYRKLRRYVLLAKEVGDYDENAGDATDADLRAAGYVPEDEGGAQAATLRAALRALCEEARGAYSEIQMSDELNHQIDAALAQAPSDAERRHERYRAALEKIAGMKSTSTAATAMSDIAAEALWGSDDNA